MMWLSGDRNDDAGSRLRAVFGGGSCASSGSQEQTHTRAHTHTHVLSGGAQCLQLRESVAKHQQELQALEEQLKAKQLQVGARVWVSNRRRNVWDPPKTNQACACVAAVHTYSWTNSGNNVLRQCRQAPLRPRASRKG
eukprot:scaffold196036_cov24-Tisochrysis_lutea.AAC.1